MSSPIPFTFPVQPPGSTLQQPDLSRNLVNQKTPLPVSLGQLLKSLSPNIDEVSLPLGGRPSRVRQYLRRVMQMQSRLKTAQALASVELPSDDRCGIASNGCPTLGLSNCMVSLVCNFSDIGGTYKSPVFSAPENRPDRRRIRANQYAARGHDLQHRPIQHKAAPMTDSIETRGARHLKIASAPADLENRLITVSRAFVRMASDRASNAFKTLSWSLVFSKNGTTRPFTPSVKTSLTGAVSEPMTRQPDAMASKHDQLSTKG